MFKDGIHGPLKQSRIPDKLKLTLLKAKQPFNSYKGGFRNIFQLHPYLKIPGIQVDIKFVLLIFSKISSLTGIGYRRY